MSVVLKIRRGTTTAWGSSSRILQVGELGIDTTLNKIKAGNGSATWTNLPWLNATPDEVSAILQSANDYTDQAISSLGNTADSTYVPISDVGNPDGVVPLDENSLIPDEYIPSTIARDSELFSGSYDDLTDKPTLFSGSYDDLSDKPTIPSLDGYATETYVDTAVSGLVDSAPSTLNTLNELAAALGDDSNYATTISTALGNKLDSTTAASTYLTQANADSTYLTQTNASSTYAPIASPTFTGTVTLPAETIASSDLHWEHYANESDLPAAADKHGMFAHVHGTGSAYFAHAGAWYKLAKQSDVDLKSDKIITINAQTSSYTLDVLDLDKMIEMSGGGTLTISDSESFPLGFTCNVLQTGSSQVTIAGSGFTPNATPGLKLRTQWSSATLVKRALNSWVIMGDLSA